MNATPSDRSSCEGVVNLVVERVVSGVFVPGGWLSRLCGGGHGGARDLVPGDEAGGHHSTVGARAHAVSSGPEVG